MSTYQYNKSWVPEGYDSAPRERGSNREVRHQQRSLIDRMADEVASWFGDEKAERRRQAERQSRQWI
jgi:hypothetical protein